MKSENIILSVVLAIVILAVGAGAGFFYARLQSGGTLQNPQGLSIMSSKAIATIITYGKITNITGRDITLSSSGTDITIHMADDATFISFLNSNPNQKNAPTGTIVGGQQKLKLSDVKTGESASVNFRVLPSGQFVGNALILISSLPPAK
jgi:hypothetical protein